jgi:hypothetical protein
MLQKAILIAIETIVMGRGKIHLCGVKFHRRRHSWLLNHFLHLFLLPEADSTISYAVENVIWLRKFPQIRVTHQDKHLKHPVHPHDKHMRQTTILLYSHVIGGGNKKQQNVIFAMAYFTFHGAHKTHIAT